MISYNTVILRSREVATKDLGKILPLRFAPCQNDKGEVCCSRREGFIPMFEMDLHMDSSDFVSLWVRMTISGIIRDNTAPGVSQGLRI